MHVFTAEKHSQFNYSANNTASHTKNRPADEHKVIISKRLKKRISSPHAHTL